jgi:NAD(P)-dependent dehydrogenase (short-subunit alcohol dehydrogenase family)
MAEPAEAAQADRRFAGRTIVITGAGGTFGRAGCMYFVLRGANVAALDRSFEALSDAVRAVREALPEASDRVRGMECDVTRRDSVEAAVRDTVAAFGRIDLLWNNAGYQGEITPTLDYPVEDFAAVMSVNVTGMFAMMQAVARQMASQDGDGDGDGDGDRAHRYAIVNTASVAGMRGTPAMVAYASSKAAVLAMTVSSAKDLAPHGIRVNAVSPALIG